MKIKYRLLFILIIFVFNSCSLRINDKDDEISYDISVSPEVDWTFIIYSNADNNLEIPIMNDIEEMKAGIDNSQNMYVINMVDRIAYESTNKTAFGEDFTDTRLYRITSNATTRLNGGNIFPEINTDSNVEINMGDITYLKSFIQYCKKYFPAKNYALLIGGHGTGTQSDKQSTAAITGSIINDYTSNGDFVDIGEFTDYLTNKESIDLLGFDACFMGEIEVAYQLSPLNASNFSASVLVSSAPEEWGYGWNYKKIFSQITNASSMSSINLGNIIVESQKEDTSSDETFKHSLSLYNLSVTQNVKNNIDNLSILLVNYKDAIESIRGETNSPNILHYFNHKSENKWKEAPYFDIYDICEKISLSSSFTVEIKTAASDVMTSIDNFIISSFGHNYDTFIEGKNGLSIFFPAGDAVDSYGNTHWKNQLWYHPDDMSSYGYYGKLLWCQDNATPDNGKIENWFEMLDSWYDSTTDINYYLP